MRDWWLNNKKRILLILGVLIVLLIIAIIIWWIFFRVKEPPLVNITPQPDNTNKVVLPVTQDTSTAPVVPQNNDLIVIARNFTERFGSYSNQVDFQNIKDLYPLMTASFKQSLNLDAGNFADLNYIGVDTKVLKVAVVEENSNSASLLVHTQRSQRGSNLQTEITYQRLALELVKSGDSWLINKADWQ